MGVLLEQERRWPPFHFQSYVRERPRVRSDPVTNRGDDRRLPDEGVWDDRRRFSDRQGCDHHRWRMGMGLETAKRFLAEGAAVVVADFNADNGEQFLRDVDVAE